MDYEVFGIRKWKMPKARKNKWWEKTREEENWIKVKKNLEKLNKKTPWRNISENDLKMQRNGCFSFIWRLIEEVIATNKERQQIRIESWMFVFCFDEKIWMKLILNRKVTTKATQNMDPITRSPTRIDLFFSFKCSALANTLWNVLFRTRKEDSKRSRNVLYNETCFFGLLKSRATANDSVVLCVWVTATHINACQ